MSEASGALSAGTKSQEALGYVFLPACRCWIPLSIIASNCEIKVLFFGRKSVSDRLGKNTASSKNEAD
jgi:hypothetical protein